MKTDNMGFLIADTLRLMRREFNKRDIPMTLMQARALIYVSRSQGTRQVALAEMLDIQPITLARLIDQLVADQLVERRSDPKDRRANCLYLTDKAMPCIASIGIIWKEILKKALQGLTQEQVKTALDALSIMNTNLSNDSSR